MKAISKAVLSCGCCLLCFLLKVVPAFESQQVIFKCNHLNGSFLAVLHYKAVCVSILSKMITVPIIPVFSPNGDKHLISPYNITT